MAKSKNRTRRIGNRVPMTVARNPVARAIEREHTRQALAYMETRIFTIDDRSHQPEFIDDCIHTVGLAMLAAEKSWKLEADVQAVLLAAVEALTRMGLDEQRRHAEMAGLIAEAVAISASVLLVIDPRDRAAGVRDIEALVAVAEQRVRAAA